MNRAGTYVYCLVHAPRKPRGGRMPPRPPGLGPVRLVDVAPAKWLVVSDAPFARYGEEALAARLSDLDWVARAAVAHEAVIERWSKASAVLPMKLFTIFASDDRAVADFTRRRDTVDALLKRVRSRHEWGVRLSMPSTFVAARSAVAGARPRDVTGARYLSAKKDVRDRLLELVTRGRDEADELYDRLSARADSARRRRSTEAANAGGTLLLDAAFLVARSRRASFHSLVAREGRRLAEHGYKVTLTGPWPPFSFMET